MEVLVCKLVDLLKALLCCVISHLMDGQALQSSNYSGALKQEFNLFQALVTHISNHLSPLKCMEMLLIRSRLPPYPQKWPNLNTVFVTCCVNWVAILLLLSLATWGQFKTDRQLYCTVEISQLFSACPSSLLRISNMWLWILFAECQNVLLQSVCWNTSCFKSYLWYLQMHCTSSLHPGTRHWP